MKTDIIWGFVEDHYPKYSSSVEIAIANDLDKIVQNECEKNEDDSAYMYFVNSCDENMTIAWEQYNAVHCRIYETAIRYYMEKLNDKENG